MSAGLSPPFPKSLDQTQKDLYLFWMSEARSKPLPSSGWIASCLSHFKSNHQMRIKQGLGISYKKGAAASVAVVPYKSFFPFPFFPPSPHYSVSHTQQAWILSCLPLTEKPEYTVQIQWQPKHYLEAIIVSYPLVAQWRNLSRPFAFH